MKVIAGRDEGFKVLLNGVDVTKRCFQASSFLGFGVVYCYKRDAKGRFYLDKTGKNAAKEKLRGRVRILKGDKNEN